MRVIFISKRKMAQILLFVFLISVSVLYAQDNDIGAVAVFFNTKRQLPIYSVDTQEKKIAISFDAAWGDEYTEELLKIMEERDIKCTFFLVGFWVDDYPDKVKKIAEAGHEIGNHSTNHPHMSKLSTDQIRMEIETTQQKIEELAGERAVKLFRPPFGDYNDTLISTCRELGFYPIQWDVDSLDWKEYGAEHTYKQVTGKVRNGSVVLFHNNAKYTAEALPRILDQLLAEGYEFVPISELIYKEDYYIDHTGRQKQNES